MTDSMTGGANNRVKSIKSVQDNMSPDDIKKKLEEYKLSEDADTIKIGTLVRYFNINPSTGKKQFRLGGKIIKNEPEYMVLESGNKVRWSVQKKNCIFYQKMTFAELKEEIIKKISKKYEKEINDLLTENEKLKETLKEIKKTVGKKSK
jgi:flavodoxin